jgi:hypothetical protein
MDKYEYIELNDNINKVLDDIITRCRVLDDNYDPKEQQFNVGDSVYYVNCYGKIIPAVIDQVENFGRTSGPGGLIYYWIIPEGCKVSLYNRLKFQFCSHIQWLPFKHKIPECFPGHAVLPGDDIFRSEEDANKSLLLYNLKYSLQDYTKMLRNQIEEVKVDNEIIQD